MPLSVPQNEMEEGMKMNSEDACWLFGPVVTMIFVTGAVIPVCLAVNNNNPLWLLLWLVSGVVYGLAFLGATWVRDHLCDD